MPLEEFVPAARAERHRALHLADLGRHLLGAVLAHAQRHQQRLHIVLQRLDLPLAQVLRVDRHPQVVGQPLRILIRQVAALQRSRRARREFIDERLAKISVGRLYKLGLQ